MDQDTEPLQQNNEDKDNIKPCINNTNYCYYILFLILAIILCYLAFCVAERNLPPEQQLGCS